VPRQTRKLALDAHRQTLSSASRRIDQAWNLPWSEIRDLPILPGHTLADDVIIVPKEMVPPIYWAAGIRTLDFSDAIPAGWDRDESRTEAFLRRLKRIVFLNFTQTVPGSKWRLKPPQAQTWIRTTRLMFRVARQAMEIANHRPPTKSACPDGRPIFQALPPGAFEQLREDNPTFFANCAQRLNGLFNAGAFDDWPAGDVSSPKMKSTPIQPFNDFAFTEILRACFFLSSIQADIEACYRELLSITQTDQGRKHRRDMLLYRSRLIRKWSGAVPLSGFRIPIPVRNSRHWKGKHGVLVLARCKPLGCKEPPSSLSGSERANHQHSDCRTCLRAFNPWPQSNRATEWRVPAERIDFQRIRKPVRIGAALALAAPRRRCRPPPAELA